MEPTGRLSRAEGMVASGGSCRTGELGEEAGLVRDRAGGDTKLTVMVGTRGHEDSVIDGTSDDESELGKISDCSKDKVQEESRCREVYLNFPIN